MKSNTQQTAQAGAASPSTNFANACRVSCRKLLAQIENIRAGILAEFRDGLAEHEHLLYLALNEAEALAWQTGFPQLFFPALASEKARAVAGWHARQQLARAQIPPLAINA